MWASKILCPLQVPEAVKVLPAAWLTDFQLAHSLFWLMVGAQILKLAGVNETLQRGWFKIIFITAS